MLSYLLCNYKGPITGLKIAKIINESQNLYKIIKFNRRDEFPDPYYFSTHVVYNIEAMYKNKRHCFNLPFQTDVYGSPDYMAMKYLQDKIGRKLCAAGHKDNMKKFLKGKR